MKKQTDIRPGKTNRYLGIYSIILGILSTALTIGIQYNPYKDYYGWEWNVPSIGMIISSAIAILGIILGKISLKYPYKIIGVIGMIICILGLLFTLIIIITNILWFL